MKANVSQITAALDKPDGRVKFFLLHGPDEAGSHALVKRLERAMGNDAERVDLEANTLASDPALLADEAASLSLFGGARFIRMTSITDDCLPAVENLLATDTSGNPVIAVGPSLKATSALVKLATAHPAALVCANYLPDQKQAEALATGIARELGLRLPPECARRLVSEVASDRDLMAQELEKIALYLDAAPERPIEATLEAFEAVGAAINDSALSTLADAVLGGRPKAAADMLERLSQDGIPPMVSARALQRRIALIADLRAEMQAKGLNPTSVVEARGKAIFYKEKPGIIRDVKNWSPEHLARAMELVVDSELAMKAAASVGPITGEADMIRLTRVGERLR